MLITGSGANNLIMRYLANRDVSILKRLWWHSRWVLRTDPWFIRYRGGLKLLLAKSGSCALTYYRGCSEPETASFIQAFLMKGMVYVDIGAHVGEFSVLAAEQMQGDGQVHAFEPNPNVFRLLRKNMQLNGFSTEFLNQAVVSNSDGMCVLRITHDPSYSSIMPGRVHSYAEVGARGQMNVRCVQLDSYWRAAKRTPNLIKLDVEGAELLALQGAQHLLSLSAEEAPLWIIELLPEISGARTCRDLLEYLSSYGYHNWHLEPGGYLRPLEFPDRVGGRLSILAAKSPHIPSQYGHTQPHRI